MELLSLRLARRRRRRRERDGRAGERERFPWRPAPIASDCRWRARARRRRLREMLGEGRGAEPPGELTSLRAARRKEQTKGEGGPAAALPSSAAPAPQRGRLGVEAPAALLPPFGRLGLPGSALRTPVAVLGPGRARRGFFSRLMQASGPGREGTGLTWLAWCKAAEAERYKARGAKLGAALDAARRQRRTGVAPPTGGAAR